MSFCLWVMCRNLRRSWTWPSAVSVAMTTCSFNRAGFEEGLSIIIGALQTHMCTQTVVSKTLLRSDARLKIWRAIAGLEILYAVKDVIHWLCGNRPTTKIGQVAFDLDHHPSLTEPRRMAPTTTGRTITLEDMTPQNIGLLKKLNTVLFPVPYSEKFYKESLTVGELAKLGIHPFSHLLPPLDKFNLSFWVSYSSAMYMICKGRDLKALTDL